MLALSAPILFVSPGLWCLLEPRGHPKIELTSQDRVSSGNWPHLPTTALPGSAGFHVRHTAQLRSWCRPQETETAGSKTTVPAPRLHPADPTVLTPQSASPSTRLPVDSATSHVPPLQDRALASGLWMQALAPGRGVPGSPCHWHKQAQQAHGVCALPARTPALARVCVSVSAASVLSF